MSQQQKTNDLFAWFMIGVLVCLSANCRRSDENSRRIERLEQQQHQQQHLERESKWEDRSR